MAITRNALIVANTSEGKHKMKITIDNRDLAYTIDTYGMFTGESVDEMESEHYRETYGLTDEEWQSIGFDYDHKAIVKGLAEASVADLENSLIGNVVKSITLTDTGSPQFYNYTTDYYTAVWDIDEVQLKKYSGTRHNKWVEWVLASGWEQDKRNEDEEYNLLAMLDFYTRETYDEESYNYAMWEVESEVYFENMQLDAESQALIDTKEEVEN